MPVTPNPPLTIRTLGSRVRASRWRPLLKATTTAKSKSWQDRRCGGLRCIQRLAHTSHLRRPREHWTVGGPCRIPPHRRRMSSSVAGGAQTADYPSRFTLRPPPSSPNLTLRFATAGSGDSRRNRRAYGTFKLWRIAFSEETNAWIVYKHPEGGRALPWLERVRQPARRFFSLRQAG